MKNILILGEEYWFKKESNSLFTESTFLLNYLEKKRDKRYNYIILQNPQELTKKINEIKKENIKAIFLFQDVLSDANLNNFTILEMKNYLSSLGVFIYPPVDIIDMFGSKNYNNILNIKLKYASLPHTQVLKFSNYKPYQDEKIITQTLFKVVEKLFKIFQKIVIKKGYSYEAKQVKTFNRDNIEDFYDFRHKVRTLNYKEFWGKKINAINMDKGIDRYYIIQGFNKIVTKRKNEYRIFFHNGRAKYIAHGDKVPNYCLKNKDHSDLLVHIIQFAKKLFKDYIKIIWSEDRLPILFRIDVSYAIDPEFQDEYSKKIDGFDMPVRIYANELEIDPTSFFYNRFICANDETFTSQQMQENLAKYLNKYIKLLKD